MNIEDARAFRDALSTAIAAAEAAGQTEISVLQAAADFDAAARQELQAAIDEANRKQAGG